MKKAFVLVLALVLTMGLAVPAAAVGTASPTAPTTSETTTAPLPEVTTTEVTAEDGTVIVVEPVEATDTKLAEEEKAELELGLKGCGEVVWDVPNIEEIPCIENKNNRRSAEDFLKICLQTGGFLANKGSPLQSCEKQ